MSEQVVSQINELLNQEKWTRSSLTTYTSQSFKEFDTVLDSVFEAKIHDEVLTICEEHLGQTKNSVTALYLSGIINLSKQSINDGNLISLIQIFTDNNRPKIAQHLAERMLDFGENKHALRTLADSYASEGDEELKFQTWERLIRVDFEEADIVLKLAERAEAAGNHEATVSYFKKTLYRFINRKQFTQVRETWKKLLTLCPEDIDFFLHAESKTAKILGEERAVIMLEDLYPVFQERSMWDTAIDVLKTILQYDNKNVIARKEIVDCYKQKHKNHSQLEEYIQLSNLGQSWRNVFDAIADFEKHIAFDEGNYVFHRTYNLGRIISIKDDFITIDFIKQKGHKMSLKLAVSALTILGKDHFWVHLINAPKAEMQKKVKENIVWSLKVIIKSFGNACDMKKIKTELVPRLLTESEWTTWSSKARKELKTDESFGNLPDKPDVFVVRDQPISLEEKTYNRFKAEKDFFSRIKIVQELLDYVSTLDDTSAVDSEHFREMLAYFSNFLKNPSQVNENTLAAYLLTKSITEKFSFLGQGHSMQFKELFEALEDPISVFDSLTNSELRKEYLFNIRKNIKTWPQYYLVILPKFLQKELVLELLKNGNVKELQDMVISALNSYKEKRELFAWFVRSFYQEEWFTALELPNERLLVPMIHLLDISARELESKKDVPENKRLQKQILNFLFKEEFLAAYLADAHLENSRRMYSMLEDVKDIDQKTLKDVRQSINKRFPELDLTGDHDKDREITTTNRGGFFTLSKSYEEKSKALQTLLEIEVPKNSKEIAVARDYGDLRENAEYKAAKERQEQLNATAARWKEELEQAKIFSTDDLDDSKIGFGTVITLTNNGTKKQEIYTIMGPWESNPDESVLSYLSPFGIAIARKTVSDRIKFVINDRNYDYSVKSIKKADLAKIKTTTPTSL